MLLAKGPPFLKKKKLSFLAAFFEPLDLHQYFSFIFRYVSYKLIRISLNSQARNTNILKFLGGVKSNISTHLFTVATDTSGLGQSWGSLPFYGEWDRIPGDLYWLWKWEEALVRGNGHYCHCCFCYKKLLVLSFVLCQLLASFWPEI